MSNKKKDTEISIDTEELAEDIETLANWASSLGQLNNETLADALGFIKAHITDLQRIETAFKEEAKSRFEGIEPNSEGKKEYFGRYYKISLVETSQKRFDKDSFIRFNGEGEYDFYCKESQRKDLRVYSK